MSFDLVTICIGYSEPALWITVVLVAALSLAMGAVVGLRLRGLASQGLRLVVSLAAGLLLAFVALVLEAVLVQVVFALLHPAEGGVTRTVCTAFVGHALLGPPILAWLTTTLVGGGAVPRG